MNKYRELIENIKKSIDEILAKYTNNNDLLNNISNTKSEKNLEINKLTEISDEKIELINFLNEYKNKRRGALKLLLGVILESTLILSLGIGTLMFSEVGFLTLKEVLGLVGASFGVCSVANSLIYLGITSKDRKKYKENIKNIGIIDMERKAAAAEIDQKQKIISNLKEEEHKLLEEQAELIKDLTTLNHSRNVFEERLSGILLCLNGNEEKINEIFNNDNRIEESSAVKLIREKNS